MNIEDYFELEANELTFNRASASDFAKSVAGDFNPIHDPESRRFCVPGDLLLAVFLHKHGLSNSMNFSFQNMVDESKALVEEVTDDAFVLKDSNGREYLTVRTSGDNKNHHPTINALTRAYVQFSGQTFPYLLVDLMKENLVMINPARPLVIYNSMEINLRQLECEQFDLKFSGASLIAEGRKAQVGLNFDIVCGDELIGSGYKNMLLGGLRGYDKAVMDKLVADYNKIKEDYLSHQSDNA